MRRTREPASANRKSRALPTWCPFFYRGVRPMASSSSAAACRGTLNALPIQAPASKPIPACPLRSARPSESSRPASVTIPAPKTTPAIPSTGLWDRSRGSAPASRDSAGAIRGGSLVIGSVNAGVALTSTPSFDRSDGHHRRKPGTQPRGQRRILEPDLHRDSLNDLREIAGGVVRRQQCELRSAGGRNLKNRSADDLSGIHVAADLHPIADGDIGQLRLTEIRLHPSRAVHERDHLGARRYELSGPDLTLADRAIGRSDDSRVAQVDLDHVVRGFLRMQVGNQLVLLRLEHGLRPP